MRANSSETRRTQHYLFSNDPWLSTPKLQQTFELDAQDSTEEAPLAPTLQPSFNSLAPFSTNERPTSSHGGGRSPSFQHVPLDKELPELPRYLKPAPLFACNNTSPVELPVEELLHEEELEDEDDEEVLSNLIMHYQEKPQSHFSTWSSDSLGYTCSASDDDADDSPTFSSLTSNCSDAGSPQRLSMRYSYMESRFDSKRGSKTVENVVATLEEEPTTELLSTTPPRLDDLRISTFGSDLFNLDIQHADSAPRRQAACFGLGFQYSLPNDDLTSKTTITNSSLHSEPNVQRESSVSQLNRLVDEFAYLGDAVS
jgi:hypothetical protein